LNGKNLPVGALLEIGITKKMGRGKGYQISKNICDGFTLREIFKKTNFCTFKQSISAIVLFFKPNV
jgi:hypothetical protein